MYRIANFYADTPVQIGEFYHPQNTQLKKLLISHVFTKDMTTWKHAANEKHKLHPTRHKTKHNMKACSR